MRSQLTQALSEHGSALTLFAYQLTHDQCAAEDLVQEAALRVLKYRKATDLPVSNPTAYLRKVIVRAFLSQAERSSSCELPAPDLPDRPSPEGWEAALDSARRTP
ncbi:MAG: RNA polymerase sigma factor [Nakamurella sp.]